MTWRSYPAIVLLPLSMSITAQYQIDDPSSFWTGLLYTIPAGMLVGISIALIVWDARR